MPHKKISGIYIITNTINGKVYIGSAKSIFTRLHRHRYMLDKNKHTNRHIQSSYNKYGASSFTFEIAEITVLDKKIMEEREEFYILSHKANDKRFGYNKRLDCRTNLGIKASDESREKMRISHIGINQSSEAKKKIAISRYREIYKLDSLGIILCKYDSIISASFENNICKQSISSACRGKIPHAGGYYWSFVDCYDVSDKFGEIKRTYKQKKFIYKNTETLETYSKLCEVAKILGKTSSNLTNAFNGRIKNNTKFIRYERE
jgi:group I intron endonuclease